MTKTAKETIKKKDFELFEGATHLVRALMDMEKNPGNGHSSEEIMGEYAILISEYGLGDVQKHLKAIAVSVGFARGGNTHRLVDFLQAEYEQRVELSKRVYDEGVGEEIDSYFARCDEENNSRRPSFLR